MPRTLHLLLLLAVAGSVSADARSRAWEGPHEPIGPALRAALASHPDWLADPAPDGLPRLYDATVASGRFLYAATEHGVSRSLDSGRTWSHHPVGADEPAVQALAADGALVWAATAVGLFRSLDAGRTWSPAELGMGRSDVQAILRVPSGTLFAAVNPATAGCALYRSRSDGQLWTCVDGGGVRAPIEELSAGSDGSVSVVRGGRSIRSMDEGHTWYPAASRDAEDGSELPSHGPFDVRVALLF